MENKNYQSKFYWVYRIGFFLILALPLLTLPPWFFPPDWGKTILFRIIFSLLIFFLAYQVLFKKGIAFNINWTDLKKRNSPIFWPFWLLISLLGFYFLSTIFSLDIKNSFWGTPARGGGFLNFAFCILFALLVFLIIRKTDWGKIWNFSFIIAGLVSLIAVFQQFGIFSEFLATTGRPPATLGNSSLLAIYLLLLTFLVFSFGIKTKNIYKKIFYFSLLSLFLFVIFLSGARAVYLGFAVGILYFFFFYPIKLVSPERKRAFILLKILVLTILAAAICGVYYINYGNTESKFFNYLEDNKTIQGVLSRLSIKSVLNDPRFSVWKISFEAIKAKPVFGYGPENFEIAFDKYYNPSLLYITKDWGSWYDRAHNFVLDISVTAGIPALIIYLLLIAFLFWQLQKLKSAEINADDNADVNADNNADDNTLIYHGIQTTFIGYLVANFFSFDSFPSYLILFLLIGYSLYLISSSGSAENISDNQRLNQREISGNNGKNNLYKSVSSVLICVLLILLIWFVWVYNVKPFRINTQINIAENLADHKLYDTALIRLEKQFNNHSILNHYLRLAYGEIIGAYIYEKPEMADILAEKVRLALLENTKIRPYYTRNWLLLGTYTNILLENEENPEIKNKLEKEADYYLEKAFELSPKRQEIFIEWVRTYIATGEYQKAKEKSQECINLNPKLAECWWLLGLTNLYLSEDNEAQNNIQIAYQKNYNISSISSILQLIRVYGEKKDYQKVVENYLKLIALNPSNPQYRATVAFLYKELGDYQKAREQALEVLKLSPESKTQIKEFLKTLPLK